MKQLCGQYRELNPAQLLECCKNLEREEELKEPSIVSVSCLKPTDLYALLLAFEIDFRVLNCPKKVKADTFERLFRRILGIEEAVEGHDYRVHSVKFQPLLLILDAHRILEQHLIKDRVGMLDRIVHLSRNHSAKVLMAGGMKLLEIQSDKRFDEKLSKRLEFHVFEYESKTD